MIITIKWDEKLVDTERLKHIKYGTVFSVYKAVPFTLYMKLDDECAVTGEWCNGEEDLVVNINTGQLVAIDNNFHVQTYAGILSLALDSPSRWLIEDEEEKEDED